MQYAIAASRPCPVTRTRAVKWKSIYCFSDFTNNRNNLFFFRSLSHSTLLSMSLRRVSPAERAWRPPSKICVTVDIDPTVPWDYFFVPSFSLLSPTTTTACFPSARSHHRSLRLAPYSSIGKQAESRSPDARTRLKGVFWSNLARFSWKFWPAGLPVIHWSSHISRVFVDVTTMVVTVTIVTATPTETWKTSTFVKNAIAKYQSSMHWCSVSAPSPVIAHAVSNTKKATWPTCNTSSLTWAGKSLSAFRVVLRL